MDHPRPTQSTDDQRCRGSGVHDIRQDLTVEHVDNKNHVAETAAGVHIHEIRDPPLIGALNLRPSPLNTNQETLHGGINNDDACGLASEYTRDSKDIHEALHLVTSDGPACLVGGVP